MPTVLSLGTTHPRNVAGIGRDLVVAEELGCSVVTAVAAVTAQDEALRALFVLPVEMLRAQIEALERTSIASVRVGALGSAENVAVVSQHLADRGTIAVVDPVQTTSSGQRLIDEEGWRTVRERLATLPFVVLTPNLDEAAALLEQTGLARRDMPHAAAELRARGASAVLLKGGHAQGDPIDVLATAEGVESFTAPRLNTVMRGRGCTLAMALACALANGKGLRDAVLSARAYVRTKMTASLRE